MLQEDNFHAWSLISFDKLALKKGKHILVRILQLLKKRFIVVLVLPPPLVLTLKLIPIPGVYFKILIFANYAKALAVFISHHSPLNFLHEPSGQLG